MLERDAELAVLRACLDRAVAGHGSVARVRAAAGLGKTTLVDRVARDAGERGFLKLAATGSELEREFGFGIARQLYEPALHDLEPAVREQVLAGPATPAGPLLGFGVLSTAALNAAQIADLFHALYWLTVNLAETKPVLLVIDDVHLADEASLRLLAFLARRLRDSPVACIVAQRSDEPVPVPLEDAIAREAVEVELAPLSESATAELATTELDIELAPELAGACWTASGGNPQLLRELFATLRAEGVADGPDAAARVAALAERHLAHTSVVRLALLDEDDRRLAVAIAVLDGRSRLPDVARLAGIAPDDAVHGLERLRSLGVASPGEPVRIVHALVREAILDDVEPGERSRLARTAARLLDEAGAEEDRVAAHLLVAEPAADAWVVARLRSAARRAMARGAPSAAVSLLERASREGATGEEQGAILHELGQAIFLASPTKSPQVLLAAARLLDDPGQRIAASATAARALVVRGETAAAIDVLEEAVETNTSPDDAPARLLLEAEVTSVARLDTRLHSRVLDGVARLERALPEEPGLVRRAVLAVLAGERSYEIRPAAEMRALALDALGDGALLEERGMESPGFYGVTFALLRADDAAGALAQFDAALAQARNHSSIASVPRACRAFVLLRLGRPGDAEVDARTALDLLVSQGEYLLVPLCCAALADALLWRGAVDEARDVLALPALSQGLGRSGLLYSHLLVRQARLAVAEGNDEDALSLLLAAGEEERTIGCENPASTEWRAEAAPVALRLGRAKLARELSHGNLEDAQAIGGVRMCGIAERVEAIVGPVGQRVERLTRSEELLVEAGDHVQRAITLVELGASLHHEGKRPLARERLREALDLAQRCGATTVAARARDEYVQAGGRVHRERVSGPLALTPSERRVAELAAAGETNMAIAQQLFVTRKTVEGHLSLAYRKLGIAGRAELAEALELD